MVYWSSLPCLQLLLPFTIGLLSAAYWPTCSLYAGSLCLTVVSLIYGLALYLRAPHLSLRTQQSMLLGLMFGLGWLCFRWHTVSRGGDLYRRPDFPRSEAYAVSLHHQPTLTKKWQRVVGKVVAYRHKKQWHPLSGRIQLFFPLNCQLKPGDVWVIQGHPQPVRSQRQPYTFDYASYLRKQYVCYQHFVRAPHNLERAHQLPLTLIERLRLQLQRIQQYATGRFDVALAHTGSQARHLIRVLVLGQREGLDVTLRESYMASGTIHLLAVSGLHVGFIYGMVRYTLQGFVWFLCYLLGPLIGCSYRFYRISCWSDTCLRWLGTLMNLVVMWGYAFCTGGAAATLRTATMATCLLLAKRLQRAHRIYNTLAGSALLLLCCEPYWLWHPGFQLSYLAVGGLVYFHPKIRALFPRRVIEKKLQHYALCFRRSKTTTSRSIRYITGFLYALWSTLSVSLAAQLITLPVSLYHFHRFPVYFLCTNWLAVPLAGMILILGLLCLAVPNFVLEGLPVGKLLGSCADLLNHWVAWWQAMPNSTAYVAPFSFWGVWLLYLGIYSGTQALKLRHKGYGILLGLILGCISVRSIRVYWERNHQQRWVTYALGRYHATAFITGRRARVYTNIPEGQEGMRFQRCIAPSLQAWGIRQWKTTAWQPTCMGSLRVRAVTNQPGLWWVTWHHQHSLIITQFPKYMAWENLPKVAWKRIVIATHGVGWCQGMQQFKVHQAILTGLGSYDVYSQKWLKTRCVRVYNTAQQGTWQCNLVK